MPRSEAKTRWSVGHVIMHLLWMMAVLCLSADSQEDVDFSDFSMESLEIDRAELDFLDAAIYREGGRARVLTWWRIDRIEEDIEEQGVERPIVHGRLYGWGQILVRGRPGNPLEEILYFSSPPTGPVESLVTAVVWHYRRVFKISFRAQPARLLVLCLLADPKNRIKFGEKLDHQSPLRNGVKDLGLVDFLPDLTARVDEIDAVSTLDGIHVFLRGVELEFSRDVAKEWHLLFVPPVKEPDRGSWFRSRPHVEKGQGSGEPPGLSWELIGRTERGCAAVGEEIQAGADLSARE